MDTTLSIPASRVGCSACSMLVATMICHRFASMREAAGSDRLPMQLPAGAPAGAVWGHLPDGIAPELPPPGIRYAVNGVWTVPGATLADGDEVALILPVSGG